MRKPSQSYEASPALCDHAVLSASRHRWTPPPLNHSRGGRYLIYLSRRNGRLSWHLGRPY